MREIQSRLGELRKSDDYVRALRPHNIHYPYDTEEQARLAKLLSQMDISKADREALFKAHGALACGRFWRRTCRATRTGGASPPEASTSAQKNDEVRL
jgi:hypothetical protein